MSTSSINCIDWINKFVITTSATRDVSVCIQKPCHIKFLSHTQSQRHEITIASKQALKCVHVASRIFFSQNFVIYFFFFIWNNISILYHKPFRCNDDRQWLYKTMFSMFICTCMIVTIPPRIRSYFFKIVVWGFCPILLWLDTFLFLIIN